MNILRYFIKNLANKNKEEMFFLNKYFDWGCKEDKFEQNTTFVDTENEPNFYKIFKEHQTLPAMKWEQLLHIYNKHLSQFILENKPVNLLEIGIFKGGSLELWQKYLPEGSHIVGIDINEQCKDIEFTNKKNIEILIGNAGSKDFLEQFKDYKFDIIIDDGSHKCNDVITSFETLFPFLNNGGLYFIEDTHTSYLENYNGGYRQEHSTMEYFKNLTDAINLKYIEKFSNKYDSTTIDKMAKFNQSIAAITFYDSTIVIEKYYSNKHRAFKNYITGITKDKSLLNKHLICNNLTKFERFYK